MIVAQSQKLAVWKAFSLIAAFALQATIYRRIRDHLSMPGTWATLRITLLMPHFQSEPWKVSLSNDKHLRLDWSRIQCAFTEWRAAPQSFAGLRLRPHHTKNIIGPPSLFFQVISLSSFSLFSFRPSNLTIDPNREFVPDLVVHLILIILQGRASSNATSNTASRPSPPHFNIHNHGFKRPRPSQTQSLGEKTSRLPSAGSSYLPRLSTRL